MPPPLARRRHTLWNISFGWHQRPEKSEFGCSLQTEHLPILPRKSRATKAMVVNFHHSERVPSSSVRQSAIQEEAAIPLVPRRLPARRTGFDPVSLGLILGVLSVAPAWAQDVAAMRNAGVAAARAGDLPGGIRQLESALAAAPSDAATLADLVVVLSWAGQDR